MCGIFGCITNKNVEQTLIKGLEYVEYRGYDSSGICVTNGDTYNITKAIGDIENLKKVINSNTLGGVGIAHTRWATTGSVSIENTHPFVSENQKIALVHNGIIENAENLKQQLNINKYSSKTDSEVIAHLLQNTNPNSVDFIDEFQKLEGSYAVTYLHKDSPNTLYVAKYKCPLYIAKCEDEVYVASDPICFSSMCKKYYALGDHEYGVLTKNGLTFYNKNKVQIQKHPITLDIDNSFINSTKLNTTHMYSEICEIPNIIQKIAKNSNYLVVFEKIKQLITKLNIKKISLIGCGTAYHSCLNGAMYLQEYAKIESSAYISSEFLYSNSIISSDTLYVFISQSGETLDTISCIDLVKAKHMPIVCITNATHSTIAHKSDIVIYSDSGKEYAVASTKTYVAQISILYNFSKYLEGKTYNHTNAINIDTLNHSAQLIPLILKYKKVFILGRARDYATALEASLKIRETCYIPTFALSCGELKHGTLALVDEDTLCIVINTTKSLIDKNSSTINEIQSRGGSVVTVSTYKITNTIKQVEYSITLPKHSNLDVVSIIPFQLLANDLSLHLKHNPDKPRNLAKSVTVE